MYERERISHSLKEEASVMKFSWNAPREFGIESNGGKMEKIMKEYWGEGC